MHKLIDIKDIENNKKIFNPQKINIFREVQLPADNGTKVLF